MIDLVLYRARIGGFSMTSKSIRFKKSSKSLSKFFSKNFRTGVFLMFILVPTMLITAVIASNEGLLFIQKSFKNSEISQFSVVPLFCYHTRVISPFSTKTSDCNSYGILNISYGLKVEIKDCNFLARYYNGNGPKRKGIFSMHLNIRSLKNKLHEVKNLIKEHGPQILGLSECELLRANFDEHYLKIPGYDVLFPSSWWSSGRARVLVYVKKSLKYRQITELQDDEIQSIWIHRKKYYVWTCL